MNDTMGTGSSVVKVLQMGAYPPPWGGVEANLYAIRRHLINRGVQCSVINLTRHRTAREPGVYQPGNWLRVLWLLLRLDYDVVHLHFGGNLTPRLLGLALVCGVLPGRHAVLTFHSGGYPGSDAGRTARARSIRGFVFRRFDAIIGVNRELVSLFRRFGVRPERIHLILPHAPEMEEPSPVLPEPLRGFFASHKPVVVTVGGLEPEYDVPLQIEAVARLGERHPKIGLVIIGSGRLEGEMRDAIGRSRHAPNILLCGDLPHTVALRAMRESALFIRTTKYDGDSIAVREALHLGVPVVATDNGMRPEGVHLIPISGLGELEGAIERLIEHPGPRVSRDQSGMENVEAVLKLYESLVRAASGESDAPGR